VNKARTLLSLFGLPRGLAIASLVLILTALTIFFLIDDVLYYLLIERLFDVHLSIISKTVLGALFVILNFGIALLVIRALLRRPETGGEAMLGARGEVSDSIRPDREGWVRVHGELWRAAAEENISKGKTVEVVAIEGLLLRVKVCK
jgi:membrane-bound serine protease (ClpP class)